MPHPIRPYPALIFAVPYHTQPYPTIPFPSLVCLALPYLTSPCPTLTTIRLRNLENSKFVTCVYLLFVLYIKGHTTTTTTYYELAAPPATMPVPRFVFGMSAARYERWRRTSWRRFAKRLRRLGNWRWVVQRLQARWWQAAMWLLLAASRDVRLVAGRLQ